LRLDEYAASVARDIGAGDPERVRRAIRRAWGLHLRQDRELRAFARLTLTIGENFEQFPPFRALLSEPGDGRMERLFATATPAIWRTAAEFAKNHHFGDRDGN
jgi:hypothetical protein